MVESVACCSREGQRMVILFLYLDNYGHVVTAVSGFGNIGSEPSIIPSLVAVNHGQ